MVDDVALLRHYAADRDEESFGALVRRHLDTVYSVALRRVGGDRHLAEDVTQEVFVALARKAAVVSLHPVLAGWLYTVTRNEAANIVRRERRRKAREQEADAMRTITDEPPTDWSRVAPMLESLVDELSEAERTIILLRYFERQSFPEIGALLRLSDDAARMRVERTLDKLRARLERRGITSTSAALGVALSTHAVTAAPAALAGSVTAAAVATSPAALFSAVSLLEFMGTTKVIVGAVGLAVIAALGTATREAWLWQGVDSELAQASADSDALAMQLREAQGRVRSATRSLVELQQSVDAANAAQRAAKAAAPRPTTTARATGGPGGRPSPEAIAAGHAFMDRHPEVRVALREVFHARLAEMYGPAIKTLNFTPEQWDQFENWMLTDPGMVHHTIGADGRPLALGGPDCGNVEMRKQREAAHRWMGEQGFARLKEAQRLLPARKLASEITGALFFTPTPLATEQTIHLAQTIAVARGTNARIDWDTVLPEASRILSAPQMTMLNSFATRDRHLVAFNETMRRNPAPSR